jgi:haloacid dehalogenase superfamily, subfamily IA, variant 3 with third motif having DD or ED/haloacid dehalogenase superfamily, subfamily IA, variant 1 with third motif having Dx(3-4)D or Dx(3-4)E
MIKTVLFDLDDTIYDYKQSRLNGLKALKLACTKLSCAPLEDLEKEHEVLLAEFYPKVLDGSISMADSMVQRTRLLFEKFGVAITDGEAAAYHSLYHLAYDRCRGAVSNVKALIEELKMSCQIGVVSNGIYEIQIEKINECGIGHLIDFMILSEDIGSRKPDKAIFSAALQKSGSEPQEAVFIGDAWEIDITGAAACGIKAIWLNRYNKECPDPGIAYEIKSFDDIDSILAYIFKAS